MDKVAVTATGILIIAGIYWFFWGKKEENMTLKDNYEIIVSGGYKPSTIYIPADKPAKLTFTRTDSNSCLEDLIFPDYQIRKYLPMNKPVEVILPSPHPKNSDWH